PPRVIFSELIVELPDGVSFFTSRAIDCVPGASEAGARRLKIFSGAAEPGIAVSPNTSAAIRPTIKTVRVLLPGLLLRAGRGGPARRAATVGRSGDDRQSHRVRRTYVFRSGPGVPARFGAWVDSAPRGGRPMDASEKLRPFVPRLIYDWVRTTPDEPARE